jgi:hypothetical protein
MIIDVTALQNFEDPVTYQKLSIGLPVDKIILLIPPTSQLTNSMFLSKLISMGYYNFTTNTDGIRYLLANPNTYRDVAHLHQLDNPQPVLPQGNGQQQAVNSNAPQASGLRILGVKNITDGAGASSLVYMMKKELEDRYKASVLAIEINKKDFIYFRESDMISCDSNSVATELLKAKDYNFILVDLNDYFGNICDEVIYLVEPSVLKLNKLMMRDKGAFERIRDKKIVINQSVLSNADVKEFAREAGVNIFCTLPEINDREESAPVNELLIKLGMVKGKK